MELCRILEDYGFELHLVRDGSVEFVEARPTPRVELSPKATGPLLLQLSRAQDEAVRYLRERKTEPQAIEPYVIPQYVSPRLSEIKQLLSQPTLTEWEEAALIYEWNVLLLYETTSDGLKMIDCLNEARIEVAKEKANHVQIQSP